MAFLLLAACSPPPAGQEGQNTRSPRSNGVAPPEVLALGEKVYSESCAMCHTTGEGSEVTAPLIGSAKVLGAPPPLIRTILYGQRGESVVNGKVLNGAMPPTDYLTDEEIAAVATYVRKEYGKLALPLVRPQDVTPLR